MGTLGTIILLGIVAACSGAQEQDVLSDQIGNATTSSGGTGSSGDTTSGATSSGTSGQTTSSGGPGTSSGGTTSGAPTGGCVVEKDDSNEKSPIVITSCAKGTLHIPLDEEDWVQFDRPSNASLHAKWSGPIAVTFWDTRGQSYDLQHLPGKPGTYAVQLQYDFKSYPLSGDQIAKGPTFDWSFEIAFQ
jgi:hypothetical protein